jgi:deoxyribonuclease-4
MKLRFGPAQLGPTKTALETLESYHKQGLTACEVAFTYSAYIKPEETKPIKLKAKELDIELSIHAPYFINLNSDDPKKIAASKQRIIKSCEIGEMLGAKVVVFHPGFYGKTKKTAYETIKNNILELQKEIKAQGWKIQLAPETMGKNNVFGSVEEISQLVKETGCTACIDFAHILARDKAVDYKKIIKLFPQKEWHVHFSGIVYGEKGERYHIKTLPEEWITLLKNLPDKTIRIINESPDTIEDAVEGSNIWKKLNK